MRTTMHVAAEAYVRGCVEMRVLIVKKLGLDGQKRTRRYGLSRLRIGHPAELRRQRTWVRDPWAALERGLGAGCRPALTWARHRAIAAAMDQASEDARAAGLDTEDKPPLDLRGVLMTAVLVMVGFTLVAAGLGWLFREPLLEIGRRFVANFGGPGVAVGFFLPDAFTVPVPNDAFTAFGLWGGMGFGEVVFWGSLGSLAGGSTGWVIGRYLLSRSARLQAYIKRRGGDQMAAHLRRGGRWFLALAAVSPVPYSVTCWAAGATKMPFGEFIAISLLRIPRVAAFLFLLEQGFVSIGG